MARYYYGTDELKHGWEEYFEICNAIEVDFQRYEKPPKMETLHRWRVESPRNFCFILHVAPRVREYLESAAEDVRGDGPSEVPEAVERAWKETLEKAEALAAKAIYIPTGGDLTPGDAHRERLGSFVDTVAADQGRPILWEPSGLWTIEQTREAADEAGVVPVYNPFIAHREGLEFTHGDVGFSITERPGMRRQFDLFDFRELLEWTRKYDRVFMMLRGRHKWPHARQLGQAIEQSHHAE